MLELLESGLLTQVPALGDVFGIEDLMLGVPLVVYRLWWR